MSEKPNNSQKKPLNFNPFVLLMMGIVACAIASFFVSPGAFDRQVVDGRSLVVQGSYHPIAKTYLSWFDIFRAVPNGLIGASSIVFLVLVVGGAIEVFNKSGAIPNAVSKFVNAAGKTGGPVVMLILFTIFAVLGGFLGWIEASIPFVPLVIPIILALGYDSLTAVALVILGSMVGFATGPTNLYTVGIAHQLAQLPMFSGFGLRFAAYLTFCSVSFIYLMHYAQRVKKDPSLSYVSGIDISDIKRDYSKENTNITTGQIMALWVLVATFAVVVYGMMNLKWGINDMTAAFLFSGILAGLLCKMGLSEIANTFMVGAKASMGGAMVVGVARGIEWILTKSGMLDPIIYGLSSLIAGLPTEASAVGMTTVVMLLNGLIASGSGKAMALMPIIVPLGDLAGISRQTVTLAYQFGDGITNMAWFTYGTLLIFLSYGKVPINIWYKFLWKLLLILFVLSIIFLVIAVRIGY